MRYLSFLVLAAFLLLPTVRAEEPIAASDADYALRRLLEGNQRYIDQIPMRQRLLNTRRVETAKVQHPFAIIVSCSDSRVPPELIFDQGLGDLFVIRVAGNIVDDIGMGSVEYAAEHLGVKLIMVLGHKRCGAVTAAAQAGEAPGHIKSIVDMIRPSIQNVRAGPLDRVDYCVRENAIAVGRKLRESGPILSHLVHEGKLKVMQGYYDLDTGVVSLLDEARSFASATPGTELSHDVPAPKTVPHEVTVPAHESEKPKASVAETAAPKPAPPERAPTPKPAPVAVKPTPPPAVGQPPSTIVTSDPTGSGPHTGPTSDEEFLKALREHGHEIPSPDSH
jgi:carbonic anhydrase